ncbi:MAG: hypothetical protein ACM3WV_07355, partial [Bacillota bacterium]
GDCYLSADTVGGGTPTPTATPTNTATATATMSPTPTATITPTPTPTATVANKRVLMIVGSLTLNAGDGAIRTRLENTGYTVTISDDNATHPVDLANYEVVYISATISSGNITNKYKSAAKPVIIAESWIFDDMGMTGTVTDTDYGTIGAQTQIDMADTHPIAGGLTGTQTIQSAADTFHWGIPGGGAATVARIRGSSTNACIFTYDAGSSLKDGTTAAGKRIGLWPGDTTFNNVNSAGQELFDRAFMWALGLI